MNILSFVTPVVFTVNYYNKKIDRSFMEFVM